MVFLVVFAIRLLSNFRCSVAMCSFLYAFLILDIFVDNLAAGLLIEARYQVDLISGLSLANRTYRGLSVSSEGGLLPLSTAVFLTGETRRVQLPPEVLNRATSLLSRSNEFTLMASIKQDARNAGTILAFSQGNNRFLELQSSGRRDELRLHYSHRDKILVETFPYRLADGSWHQVAVSVSGTHVAVFVNCSRIYKRVIREVDCQLQDKNLTLWFGQRNANHFLYKGYLQDVKIVGKAHGYVMQCPHIDTECPTCGQFRQLQVSVFHLESIIQQLNNRLLQAESRLAAVEECECQKNCFVNNSLRLDGSTWRNNCDECACVHGEVKCQHIKCNETNCKYPVKKPGECCPKCLGECFAGNMSYMHGERKRSKCMECECQDGRLSCNRTDPEKVCPKLNCSESEQFNVSGECCPFCPGMDHCAGGHDCHLNATCLNVQTRYICQCNLGYEGNGKNCTDIDECLKLGGHDGHHCHANTVCTNVPGSYTCECLPGYTRQDAYTCVEYDECRAQDHQCDKNAKCVNTDGSYQCHCQEGFSGDGFKCHPVCNQTCQNGNCTSPGVCTCLSGYSGPRCDIDVDECGTGQHHCHSDTICVNMPGWYYCQCKPGYKSRVSTDSAIHCQDIDECKTGAHTCHKSATCVNEVGGYRCECNSNVTCSLDCLDNEAMRFNGETWHPFGQSCSLCECKDGVTTCVNEECDCANPDVDLGCCPECDRSSTCQHQEANISYRNGDQWIYQCETCECLYGEVDCWPITCKPARCENPVIDPGSSCCPICPDDPCSSFENGTKGCSYAGKMYLSGEKVPRTQDPCSSCKCNNGKICCSFMGSCLGLDMDDKHQVARRSLLDRSGNEYYYNHHHYYDDDNNNNVNQYQEKFFTIKDEVYNVTSSNDIEFETESYALRGTTTITTTTTEHSKDSFVVANDSAATTTTEQFLLTDKRVTTTTTTNDLRDVRDDEKLVITSRNNYPSTSTTTPTTTTSTTTTTTTAKSKLTARNRYNGGA